MTSTRICNTPGCGRSAPSTEHGYCDSCIGVVLRTGQPPVIERADPFEPEWRRRARLGQLSGKDYTGEAVA